MQAGTCMPVAVLGDRGWHAVWRPEVFSFGGCNHHYTTSRVSEFKGLVVWGRGEGRGSLPCCRAWLTRCHPPTACDCTCRSPITATAVATSPTTAAVTLNPPSTGGPVSSYTVTMCSTAGGACVTAACPTINCLVPGLTPNTQYSTTAVATQSGKPSAPSEPVSVTTPPTAAPALTSATPTSPTTAIVTADPPAGTTFKSVG